MSKQLLLLLAFVASACTTLKPPHAPEEGRLFATYVAQTCDLNLGSISDGADRSTENRVSKANRNPYYCKPGDQYSLAKHAPKNIFDVTTPTDNGSIILNRVQKLDRCHFIVSDTFAAGQSKSRQFARDSMSLFINIVTKGSAKLVSNGPEFENSEAYEAWCKDRKEPVRTRPKCTAEQLQAISNELTQSKHAIAKLYHAYDALIACNAFDGVYAEGFQDSGNHLLAHQWGRSVQSVVIEKEDFAGELIHQVSDGSMKEDFELICSNARKKCPINRKAFCAKLMEQCEQTEAYADQLNGK